jgi:heme/copper-type cytochrome/quinol oxidase subunit 2
LLESAREQKKEIIVFALVVLTAAWPVIYMVVTVVQLLRNGQPLDQ